MVQKRSKIIKYAFVTGIVISIISIFITSDAKPANLISGILQEQAQLFAQPDSTEIPFSIKDNRKTAADPEDQSPLYLEKPANIQTVIEYDSKTKQYIVREQVAGVDYRLPSTMTFEEYSQYHLQRSKQNYWRSKKMGTSQSEQSFIPSLNIRSEAFDKIFGSNTINITPQGSAELIFGYQMNKIDNPTFTEKMRKTPSFNFEEKIQMNVTGTIGEKVQLGISYNTEATFEFENETNLEYKGDEDEIIKKIEAGNLSFSLPGSLIPGSQNLFGVRADMQFGKLNVQTVFSQQKSESSSMQVQGGAQVSEFEVNITDYDANRHFFLSHYFKERYDDALEKIPFIKSNIEIRNVEVWVTNRNDHFENARDIVAFIDLGEGATDNISNPNVILARDSIPSNNSNNLYENLDTLTSFSGIEQNIQSALGPNIKLGVDYEKIEKARKLDARDYTINKELGYISLNSSLNNDEILGVAYTYKKIGQDSTYKVGELSNDKSPKQVLVVKLLKGTNLSPKFKTWELMMKNIYSIGAYQVQKEDFRLNVMYRDDRKGRPVAFIPENETQNDYLLDVLGMDRINYRNEAYSDGVFDYIPGLTILPQNGRIIFTTLRPFDDGLRNYFDTLSIDDKRRDALIEKYAFPDLYDDTKTKAEQKAEKNKFFLSGSYKSSSGSEIQLNAMNIPQGSVRVTAGGIELSEGSDYTVDYTLGRVKILNQSILEAGTPINISMENNALFNFQTKTLIGTHMDYKFSDDFVIGGTFMHLNERPLTSKVNMGDEPISNTIWGLNGNYKSEAPFLTKFVDKIPFIETKEPSNISVDAEFAQLIPGSPKAIGKNGRAYIDDFEGSETSYDLTHPYSWYLSSTPNHDGPNALFPEADSLNQLIYNFNRARLAFYIVDPLFNTQSSSLKPSHIGKQEQSNHFVREIYEEEIWPNKDRENNIPARVSPMNVAFYPDERGPYNFDTEPTPHSAGMSATGKLNDPESRWGGMMRAITSSDFEQQNVEFIEFWVMDPYAEDTMVYHDNVDKYGTAPALYFNLGDISEDILKDGLKSFEHGLPADESENVPLDSSVWGYVSKRPAWTNGFDTDESTRANQDVGLDGLIDGDELDKFADYVNWIKENVDQASAYSDEFLDSISIDPAGDNYHYFRGSDYDARETSILDRYKYINGMEQNSRTSSQSDEDYTTTGRTLPDQEDINDDNTLNYTERFYEYKISMHPDDLRTVGENHITYIRTTEDEYANGEPFTVRWIQFKIPLDDHVDEVGGIDDFKSIRFMRMYLNGFRQPVVMRFASIDLVRSNWRRYDRPLYDIVEDFGGDYQSGKLSVSAINIEENGDRYVLPPGFDREIDPSNPQLRQLNEQSMVLKVSELADGDARAVYKNVDLDLRQYQSLKMEIHGESLEDYREIENGDLTVFLRMGSDYVDNYYEYEIPLSVTDRQALGANLEAFAEQMWPESNSLDIDLQMLIEVKKERNRLMNIPGSMVDYFTVFEMANGNNSVYVRGNPNLSNVRTIMIGVRNTTRSNYLKNQNDGDYKSAEIWVNELRLEDFRDKSGWAANARAKANLADFGNISLATAYSTPGFGTIEQKVNERAQETAFRYDVAANLELGKFFPEDAGVSIPVYVNYSKTEITPEYDPEDPDIKLVEQLKNLPEGEAERKKDRIIDQTERKSISFTNVRVDKKSKTPRFYDPANISLSYSYSEQTHSDIEIEKERELNYKAALNYIYSSRAKNVKPLDKVKFLNSKYLGLIKDFNFYYLPSKVSFRTDLNRQYEETKIRLGDDLPPIENYFKDYTWGRYYDVKWDLSRSLTFDFNATNLSRFDENPEFATDEFPYLGFGVVIDTATSNLQSSLGDRTLNYKHSFNIGYRVPINKIPITDWMSINTKYTGQFNWISGPLSNDEFPLYNTISNSYNFSVNNSNRLTKLYHKVPILKKIDQKYSGRTKQKVKKEYKTVTYVKEKTNLRAGAAKSVNHKLKTEDVTIKVYDKEGNEIQGELSVVNENKVRFAADQDVRGARIVVEGQVEKKPNPAIWLAEQGVRVVMGLKDVSLSFSQSEGTIIPGYKGNTNLLGRDWDYASPSYMFLAGFKDENILQTLSQNELISVHQYSPSITRNLTKNYDAKGSFEPFNGFKLRFNLFENESKSYIQSYISGAANPFDSRYEDLSIGNYSMSYISIKTAFENPSSKDGYASEAFNLMNDNLAIVSQRMAQDNNSWYANPNISPTYTDQNGNEDPDYRGGFGPASQRVLLPSFIAAYTGQPIESIDLYRNRPDYPLPNWQLNITSLSEIPFMKRLFKSVTINHSYRSKYNVSSITQNDEYYFNNGYPNLNIQGDFYSQYLIGSVSIDEQFAPLGGLELQWHNSLITNIEYKQSRRLRLNFGNPQVLEDINKDWVVGLGYNIKDFVLQINAGNGPKTYQSDLILRADFSFRNNLSVIRSIGLDQESEYANISGGEKRTSVKFTADYAMTENFNVSFFYNYDMNKPAVSTSYPYANTHIGFSIRFTLIQ